MPTQLIFPLDFADLKQALKYVDLLKDEIPVFKIGLELFVSAGPDAIKCVLDSGGRGYLLGPGNSMISLKLSGERLIHHSLKRLSSLLSTAPDGPNILTAAVKSVSNKTKILAVTVLTSQSEEELKKILLLRDDISLTDLVIHRAAMAKASGCAGVVCSGHEISAIREHSGSEFIIVTPGIRPVWSLIPRR